jgi:two-component system, OmpR family, alkaline phosphatase synthesis response regulator PhoP
VNRTVPKAPSAKKILIAEDEPNIVISLEFLLKEAGYEVAIARDGSQALSLAGTLRPDLIVLDVMLPALNGFDVCRRIRGSREAKNTKVLMLTARGRESEVARGMSAGADAYMTKPFANRELMKVVAKLLSATD